MNKLIVYNTPSWLTAFTTGKGSGVEALGFQLEELALPRQVHSDNVLWMHEPGRPEATDAVITDQPGLPVCVRTADCIPVLLYDPVQRAVAAVHAGWKGTVMHISQKTINVMVQRFGCNPSAMRAVIGPGIGPDSFQVGEEVAEHFKQADFPMDEVWSFRGPGDGSPMSGGHHIDLFKANRWLLEDAGVPAAHIQITGIDTFTDESFFSARREGARCGRIINAIKLLPPAQGRA